MGDQGDQSVLLAPGELTKALQQLTFVQGQFRTVEAQCHAFFQRAFLQHALFKPSDDFGIHAAMMIAGNVCDALAHAFRQADNEFVSRTAGIDSLFHRAHTLTG